MDSPSVSLDVVVQRANDTLSAERFKDHGPNGLQVEGRAHVRHLVTGVTASLAFIEQAIAVGADALLVHHGLFWRGQDGRVTGWMKKRLHALLTHDVSLLAYHLPLDAHPTLGNNAQLARVLGWSPLLADDGLPQRWGEQHLGWLAACEPQTAVQLQAHVATTLGRSVTLVDGLSRPIRRIAWCTGGAQSYFEDAIAAGADAFVTGEISEPQAHYAREMGVAYLACGHHATERYGAPAVGAYLAAALGLRHTHIDVDNPA